MPQTLSAFYACRGIPFLRRITTDGRYRVYLRVMLKYDLAACTRQGSLCASPKACNAFCHQDQSSNRVLADMDGQDNEKFYIYLLK